MYKDLENQKFDFLILGTNLTESALSAYLAKSKYKIIQIDISKSYGGDCKNFNLRDMENFMKEIKDKSMKDCYLQNINIINHEIKKEHEPVLEKENFRQYNFDLNPKFLYAKSKSSTELIDSKASNYIEFNSIRKIYFMFDDKFLNVPFSKSEIFISNDLDLLEKQKLLNFIFSVMKLKNNNVDVNSTVDVKKDIELDDDFLFNEIKNNLNKNAKEFLTKYFNNKITNMILLILSNENISNIEMTVDQMCDKIYKFLISVQIYDNTPFLIPQYGSSEFTQAMSRLSAVNGSIFLINDLLECDIKYNKENTDDKNKGKFIIEVNDGEKNEKFLLNVDRIILNNSYLDENNLKVTPVKLSEEIKKKIKNKKENNYVYKYTAFYSIKAIGQLLSIKEGPHYYRVPKNNSLINNEYELDAIKYFNNTCVAPNNRILLYIQIFSEFNEKSENDFISKAKKISENFVNKIINETKEDINKNYNNEEFKKKCNFSRIKILEEIDKIKEEEEKKKKEEEEKKKKEEEEINNNEEKKEEKEKEKVEGAVYIPPKRPRSPPKIEEISLNPEIIMKYEFNQKIEMNDYFLEDNNNNDIIFTKNNSLSTDLDEYFEESFDILKQNNLIKEEIKEDKKEQKEEVREIEDEDEIEDNNLIDELFNEIGEDEEEKKEEEKKEEEKMEIEKQDEKKEEDKKEENKIEDEKKEEDRNEEKKEEKKE